MSAEFYDRPMVIRLRQIFGDPHPPKVVTEQQFDWAQEALVRTAAKPWHEIGQDDYWQYLMDLCYVDLQQDLFDYLFPAFLIRWWEGQLNRLGGPEAECDFYRAIDQGQVFTKMMDEPRRQLVCDWISDAYVEGVDAWSGQLSVKSSYLCPDNLHGPLWSFNALAQSVPFTGEILERLGDVSTMGRAQWWLVLAGGIIWNENTCPAVAPWSKSEGGGGIYVTSSKALIHEHGYLPKNLEMVTRFLTYPTLLKLTHKSSEVLSGSAHGEWAHLAWEEVFTDQRRIELRLARFIHLLGLPHLGGVLQNPLDADD